MNVIPLVEYSTRHVDKLKRLCRPLFETFGFSDFLYAKTTADGLHSGIETHIDFMESVFNDGHFLSFPQFTNPETLRKGFFFYNNLGSNGSNVDYIDRMHLLGKKFKNISYLGCVAKVSHDEIIRFGYGINPQHNYLSSFILNNFPLLEQFNNYFIENAYDILKGAEQCPIDLKAKLGSKFHFQPQPTHPLEQPAEKCRFLATLYGVDFSTLQSLTLREIECLKHLLDGLTKVEIGKALFISPRTVETHLENIKNKLGCSKKSELLLFASLLVKAGF